MALPAAIAAGGRALAAFTRIAKPAAKTAKEIAETPATQAAMEAGKVGVQASQQLSSEGQAERLKQQEDAKRGAEISTGEPMEVAWQMLKMPIVSEEPDVRYSKVDPMYGENHPPAIHNVHRFQDPVTDEMLRLVVSPAANPNSESLYASIEGNERDDYGRLRDRAGGKFNTGGGDYASLDGVETKEPYRRRGYMSAIYDAVEEYLRQHKGGRKLVPSDFQSDEGKAFWESRVQTGEPMDLSWQMLKMDFSTLQLPHQLSDKMREDVKTLDREHTITDTNEGTLIENIHPDMETVLRMLTGFEEQPAPTVPARQPMYY